MACLIEWRKRFFIWHKRIYADQVVLTQIIFSRIPIVLCLALLKNEGEETSLSQRCWQESELKRVFYIRIWYKFLKEKVSSNCQKHIS